MHFKKEIETKYVIFSHESFLFYSLNKCLIQYFQLKYPPPALIRRFNFERICKLGTTIKKNNNPNIHMDEFWLVTTTILLFKTSSI